MEKSNSNGNAGIQHTLVGDYYLPNLVLPPQKDSALGKFGRMRLRYLKNHCKVLYINLLTSGALSAHLHEVEEVATDRLEMLVQQMAVAQGVSEQLKAENQMLWVQKMNIIRACAEEIVLNEIIYE